MPDEFSSATKGLVAVVTDAIVAYGRQHLGRELNKADLYQMTTSLEESVREILWFGFDLWPSDTDGQEFDPLSDNRSETLAVA